MPKQTFYNLPEKKKKQIFDAAIEEFAKAPYQDISINHLIECMGIPTGSFYQYFEDKKDLYFYVISFYVDAQMNEAVRRNIKINLFESDETKRANDNYTETRKLKYCQEILFDNFQKAPKEIKRDWTFDHLIGGKYKDMYDYSFFDSENLDPAIKENADLLMGVALAFANVIHRFCDKGEGDEEEWKKYHLCAEVLKLGMMNYHSKS